MTRKQKKTLIRIGVSLVLFLTLFIVDHFVSLGSVISHSQVAWLLPFFLYLIVYLVIGYDVLWKAIKNSTHGNFLDENFLMIVATLGAFGIQEYSEAVAVMLFYQLGEWFQNYAVYRSRNSISSLMELRPDSARIQKEDGTSEIVDPDLVEIGDIIIVEAGEKIPLDGVVIEGNSTLDTSSLTGESLPRSVEEQSEVCSGVVNLTSTLKIKVTKSFSESTVSKILDLVENATSQKAKAENFITRFAKWYTPIVVGCALLLFLIPGAITGEWINWLQRALNFLVVSCPCALVISIPLSFFAGIGGASKQGILVKGSSYLEKLAKANIFVFDKTGTLTKGNFKVVEVYPAEKKEEILYLASIAESGSSHPIATSILKENQKEFSADYQKENIAGKGIVARKGEDVIVVGNDKMMIEEGIPLPSIDSVGTIVHVARQGQYIGTIVIADEIKEEAKEFIQYLKSIHAQSIMLTGDRKEIAASVAQKLEMTSYRAELLPQDKVQAFQEIVQKKKSNDVCCFVGDGVNDAPTMMYADIGIAMGGVGSDAAIEASDVVLMYDRLSDLKKGKKIAVKTSAIVKENIIFAIGVKVLVLILSAFGLANMWLAVFADVGVAFLAILNAMRAGKVK